MMEQDEELLVEELEIAETSPDGIDDASVGGSAALISACTIISRITGFLRTWSMAYALGATFLSSSYQIANNLPSMLYELVMGGMLTTAFLPVYLSIKKKLGKEQSSAYASNLLTLVVVFLGILAALCMVFPAQVIYTQSFYSDQAVMGTATLFFQFFAIQVVFYGASSIISGLLNANRDYIWGAIAPVFNNVIVIAAFIIYAAVAPSNPDLAIYIIAIGSPLGVFVQMALQIPGLKRCGIRLRPRLDFKDPALKETASIGLPALFVTICGFVTVSVANAASYSFADNGPSVLAYSRLWYTFPYSILAIPVSTAMFTELSSMQAEGNTKGVVKGIVNGSNQIYFLLIPFAIYLMVFAQPLVTLYHIGAFDSDGISQIASYLVIMAISLPFYGVNSYLLMVFSSVRRMLAISIITLIGSVAQVAIIVVAVWLHESGADVSLEWVAVGTIAAYVISNVGSFAYLAWAYRDFDFDAKSIAVSCMRALLLGLMGGACGGLMFWGLEAFVAPVNGSLPIALAYLIVCGVVSIFVTFAPAIRLNLPEASFITALWGKLARKLKRS